MERRSNTRVLASMAPTEVGETVKAINMLK